MKDGLRLAAAGSVIALLVWLLAFPALAHAEDAAPACPFTSGYVVDLGSQMIRSDLSAAEATTDPVAVEIPAGTYDIWLFSYDPHDGGSPQSQAHEQWYVTDGDFRSGTIADLPDDVDTLLQQVDAAVAVPALSQVWAFHAAYPTTGDPYTYANSIHPVCAAFVPVQIETTTTTVPETTTTTVPETTTTTVPETTTTTVPETTTTTAAQTTTTTVPETTTTVSVLETTVTNSPTTAETLPFTGADSAGVGGVAFALIALGALTVLALRPERQETPDGR